METDPMNGPKPVTVLRCALCGKSFAYIPAETDHCRPDDPKIICDGCYKVLEQMDIK